MPDLDQKAIEGHQPLLLEEPEHDLRRQIEDLKRQLEEQKEKGKKKEEHAPEKPKARTLWIIALVLIALLILAFFLGWLPHHRREAELKKEAQEEQRELPRVDFVHVHRSAAGHQLLLPGNAEAYTDAPILARADGYVRKRYVDIGDRVKQGQLMADIDAPDLDQQVRQGVAQLAQAQAADKQANAALQQGIANAELARVTATRWENLVKRGAVSRQENDTYQANYQAQASNVAALKQAVEAADENVGAAQANLQRLKELQGFEQVRAPFDGVVTVRNVDVGALIATGNTLLFRVAQIDRLRTYVYVPQAYAASVQVGQKAELLSQEFGDRPFNGIITRTASALDPNTRTMLTEVQVPNPNHLLLPGMFLQVNMMNIRVNPPILIPGDALIVRSEGTFVATLVNYHKVDPKQVEKEDEEKAKKAGGDQKKSKDKKNSRDDKKSSGQQSAGNNNQPQEVLDGTVKFNTVNIGRDYGNSIEIYTGLNENDLVIVNPNDSVSNGSRVEARYTKPRMDQLISAPPGTNNNVNSESLQKKPGAEPLPKQPSQMDKTRGSSH